MADNNNTALVFLLSVKKFFINKYAGIIEITGMVESNMRDVISIAELKFSRPILYTTNAMAASSQNSKGKS